MSAAADYIPRNDSRFSVWLKTLVAYLTTKITPWKIPQADVTELNNLSTAFANALAVTENPATRTKVTIQAKNTARKNAEDKARMVVRSFVTCNPAVTDVDREAIGLPIHKTTHTPVHIPTTFPEADAKPAAPAVIKIIYQDSVSGNRARPYGVRGAEFGWAILNHAPVDWSELIHSTFFSRSPAVFSFEGHQRGQTLYFAARWENTKGQKGPWSVIQSTIIP